MTNSYVTWLIRLWHDSFTCEVKRSYVTWRIHMWHDSYIYVIPHIHVTYLFDVSAAGNQGKGGGVLAMTPSYVTWLIHMWYDPFIHNMTLSHLKWVIHTWHDSFTCDMAHSCVCCQATKERGGTKFVSSSLVFALQHIATRCNTITYCNTMQHTATLHLRWIQPRTTNWIIKLPRLYEPLEGAPEQVMSHVWIIHVTHVNEWCHTCEWVLSHMWFGDVAQGNKSCHTYGSHKCRRRSWRMSHVTCEWVMSRVNESCHMWMSHVTCEWVMSHVNESCRMWMSHVTCERVMSRVNESCHMRRSHVKCE